ncbi:MAG: dihydroorotate dehydrogenase electron transfer subunit [Solirubrobacteraceae bacterium]|nr:dihydroorotate dehydrogenase electron transfer subunit [Solirubrobacteraceae bacterium]
MDRTLAPLGRRLADVTGRRALGAYFVLTCADEDGPRPQPGQFYMLAAAERWAGGTDERPFLPRAFSVARVTDDGELEFMLEDVGPGTRRLAELRAGDGLWLLGPLGKPFAPPRDGRRPVLVGGGVGTAPIVMLHDQWPDAQVILGFRDAEHAVGAELIEGAQVATDDGSVGHHGLVTDLIPRDEDIQLFACGPPPMLEAVRRLGIPAQLALESGMACGFGACFGCVVPTRHGYVRLCVDGPVLDAADLEVVW